MHRFLSKLTRSLRNPNPVRAARRAARRSALQVEALEDRRLLTTFVGTAGSVSKTANYITDPIQAEYHYTAYETDAGGRNVQQLLGAAQGGEVAVPWVSGALMQQYAVAVPHAPSMTFNSGYIGFSDGTPVGGSVQLTVNADGSFEVKGHFHDSGFLPETISGVVAMVSPSGESLWTQPYSASMAGTIGSGSRDADFDIHGTSSVLSGNWADFEGGVNGHDDHRRRGLGHRLGPGRIVGEDRLGRRPEARQGPRPQL